MLGKTTLVSLLLKFYDINSGDIKIDGVSIQKLERENLHKICTMVFQESWIFDGTIKENIVYNRKDVSEERVKEICFELGLDKFINKLPKGYDTKISEKDNLSAGQKQLITLARGLVEDAPILILDEAMSNLDTVTEKKIRNVIEKLVRTKTIIIISHRLSVVKDSDFIIFMKNGKIAEQGTHKELVRKNGEYAKLYNIK